LSKITPIYYIGSFNLQDRSSPASNFFGDLQFTRYNMLFIILNQIIPVGCRNSGADIWDFIDGKKVLI
jgi:hypothetical protein